MSSVRRLYALNPWIRVVIAVGCVALGAALVVTGALGLLAVVPIFVAFAIAGRLVPGGRMTLVPLVEEASPPRTRLRRSVFTAVSVVITLAALGFAFAGRPIVFIVLAVAAIVPTLLADALSAR